MKPTESPDQMKRSQRIKPVQDIAGKNEQARSVEYVRCKQRYEEACNKLEELQTYQAEYATSMSAGKRATDHLDVMQMHDNRVFLSRLSEVVRLQEQAVQELLQQMEQAKNVWLQSRHRSKSLDNLAENYLQQEASEAQRLEQRLSDEMTTQRFVWRALHTTDMA